MYENQSYEKILSRMLDKALSANSNLDTREGSLVWLGNAPAAVELQNLYIALQTVLDETFADTASRPYLILRAAERGIAPYPASPAVLEMKITPISLSLPIHTRFTVNQLNYFVSADKGGGVYELTCETAGDAGNIYAGTVIPIEYVEGLQSCTITSILVPGEDEEETEEFRKRYFDSLNAQAFGGNRRDYIDKVNALPGVGGVKVYRAWNGEVSPSDMIPPEGTAEWISGLTGVPDPVKTWVNSVFSAAKNNKLTTGGTVKLVIQDSTFTAPSTSLVEQVQTAVDPIQSTGNGEGLAPIGHVVRVEGVKTTTVNVACSIYYQHGWTWDDVSEAVTNITEGYFLELAEIWAKQPEPLVVRISQIESRLLDIPGILDVSKTKINDVASNFTLQPDHIPCLGTISASTIEVNSRA